jgi:hypothetical protein
MPRSLLALLLASVAVGQTGLTSYLEKNRQAVDLANFDAKLLDFHDKQIIFLDENHGIALNDDLDFALLKYLHREAGVRVYLGEYGYAAGFALNQYMETGDEKILDYIMKESKGSPGWTKERRAFYANVRQWNASLPAADRIRFVGIDVEHQRGLALKCLAGLAGDRQAPPSIADTVAKLRQGDYAGLPASLKEHRAEFEQMLGERFFDFETIATNIGRRDEFYADHMGPKGAAVRERTMYETFCKVYARMGGGRWYGRWGSFHVIQRKSPNRERFANMLNQPGSPVAGKVLSILSAYRATEAMTPEYGKIAVAAEGAPVDAFTAAATGPITLFRLDDRKIPKFEADAGAVQYVMFIQNASASHPLEEVATNIEDLPPVVVRSVPESGSREVPADLKEVRVTFSKEMKDSSWSWCSAGPLQPPPLSNVHYDPDHRTIVGTAKLEAGKKYAVWLNSDGCSNFRDAQGHSAVPYLLTFETAAKYPLFGELLFEEGPHTLEVELDRDLDRRGERSRLAVERHCRAVILTPARVDIEVLGAPLGDVAGVDQVGGG